MTRHSGSPVGRPKPKQITPITDGSSAPLQKRRPIEEVLLDFAAPVLVTLPPRLTPEIRMMASTLVMMGWNVPPAEDSGARGPMNKIIWSLRSVLNLLPGTMRGMLDQLYHERRTTFADDPRLFDDLKIEGDPPSLRFVVNVVNASHYAPNAPDKEDTVAPGSVIERMAARPITPIPSFPYVGERALAIKTSFAGFRRRRGISLAVFRPGRMTAAEMDAAILRDDTLKRTDRTYARRMYVHNAIADMTEAITSMPEMHALNALLVAAEDDFKPGYPPMSPNTQSWFNFWALYDATDASRETFATCLRALADPLCFSNDFLAHFDALVASRPGLFVHEGFDQDRPVLRELVTGTRQPVFNASGYKGQQGEVWLTRVLPALGSDDCATMFSTPYVTRRTDEAEWEKYLSRALPATGIADRGMAYIALMKYGFTPLHWLEYILAAYSNHTDQVVFLEGLPDRRESLPHGDVAH